MNNLACKVKECTNNCSGLCQLGRIKVNGNEPMSSSGTYCGIAPASHLIGIRILNRKGSGKTEDMLTAFDWILAHRHTYQIRIVNISIGCSSAECLQDGENSLLVQGAEKLWDAGLVVVAAAGNEGPDPMSITIPGISRRIITVGASDDQHLPSRRLPTVRPDSQKDPTPLYSGRGPTTSCIRAARDALNGWDPTGGCLYYYNPQTATNAWIWTRQVQLSIGRHAFAI